MPIWDWLDHRAIDAQALRAAMDFGLVVLFLGVMAFVV